MDGSADLFSDGESGSETGPSVLARKKEKEWLESLPSLVSTSVALAPLYSSSRLLDQHGKLKTALLRNSSQLSSLHGKAGKKTLAKLLRVQASLFRLADEVQSPTTGR